MPLTLSWLQHHTLILGPHSLHSHSPCSVPPGGPVTICKPLTSPILQGPMVWMGQGVVISKKRLERWIKRTHVTAPAWQSRRLSWLPAYRQEETRRPPGRYRSAERGLGVKLTLSFPFVLAVSSPPPWPRQRFGSLAVAQCRPLGWQATRLSDAGLFLITKLDHLVHAKFGKSPQAAETNRNLLIFHKLFISWDFTGVPS